ncbi:hypothetical protein Gohar_002022, partial [Gossypium harknessii]|nr:hypothetical protein [Gossypium harknessii]
QYICLKVNEFNFQTPLSPPPKFSNWIQLNSNEVVKESARIATIGVFFVINIEDELLGRTD